MDKELIVLIIIVSLGVISLGGLITCRIVEKRQSRKWARALVERCVNPR